jgi:hypothetical protein
MKVNEEEKQKFLKKWNQIISSGKKYRWHLICCLSKRWVEVHYPHKACHLHKACQGSRARHRAVCPHRGIIHWGFLVLILGNQLRSLEQYVVYILLNIKSQQFWYRLKTYLSDYINF